MITLNNLSKGFGARMLFEEVDIVFTPGNRYGLTGPNGAGKSTFMRILAGDVEPDSGQIILPDRMGILRQDQYAFDEYTVMDTVIQGNGRLWKAMEEKEVIYAKGDAIDSDDDIRLGELEMIVAEEDGYMADTNIEILLQGLNVPNELHYSPMKGLPASVKVRVLLAQALFGDPEALLLDEPTNQLDLDSIEWLQEFLVEYTGTLVVISHDKHFLNSVVTHIADIDYKTIIMYPGNYDEMVEAKLAVRARAESEVSAKRAKIEKLNEFIQRFRSGSRASQVKSRQRQVDKLSVAELKRSNIQRPFIRFEVENQSGKDVLRIENANLGFEEKGPHEPALKVCDDFTAYITRGERIAIIGPSGCGKSALLHMLAGMLAADSGDIRMGHNVDFGFYQQDNMGALEPGHEILDWLHGKRPGVMLDEVRGYLGRMLFTRDDATKKTEHLSGGERARLLFSELMIRQHNLLFFDEPTNHLDLESISALGEGLAAYQGTCFVVTHNHDLINTFATRVWGFIEGEIFDVKGNLDDWRNEAARLYKSYGNRQRKK